MARLIILVLGLLAGSAVAQQSRIVGGWPADENKWTFMVQVNYYNVFGGTWSQSCSGNIINLITILTVAHCTEALPIHRQIRAGSYTRNYGGILKQVERITNHPAFGTSGADSDISLIKLDSLLTYGPSISPISIISQGTFIPYDLNVSFAGWGTTESSGVASPELLETQAYTINTTLCAERYLQLEPNPATVTENMICVGVLDVGGRDACQGDSGGPVLYSDILIGMSSWGHGCGDPFFPGVNTAIAPFSNWIVENTSY